MQSGKLRHRITISGPPDPDSMGNYDVNAWVPFAENVPAWVQSVSGISLLKNDQVTEKLLYRVKIRYLPGVEEQMRVEFHGRNFSIDYIEEPDGKKTDLWLVCSEIGTNG